MRLEMYRHNKVSLTLNCIGYVAPYGIGIIAMELRAVEQAVQAVWSELVMHRNERNATDTRLKVYPPGSPNGEMLQVVPRTKFMVIPAPNRANTLILCGGFGRMVHEYLLGGDEEAPSPWLHRLFTGQYPERMGVPVLEEWLPVLWKAGINAGLLTVPNNCQGQIAVWRVVYDRMKWRGLISTLIKKGVLS